MISVIGCGYWGKNIISTVHNMGKLSSVHDLDSSLQASFSEKYSLKNISYDEMLSDQSIEGVMVATSADTHFKIAKDALLNRKDVFIEKPICLNIEDANELGKISEDNDRMLMVGHLLQYHDHFVELKRLCKEKYLGKILRIRSSRKSLGIMRSNEDVIWSFAPHDISMIFSLCDYDEINNINIKRQKFFNNNTDRANITFNIGDTFIEIDLDWTSVKKEQRLEVYCEKGIIIFDDAASNKLDKLQVLKYQYNPETLKSKNTETLSSIAIESDYNPLKNECCAFIKCISDRKQPFTDHSEATRVLSLLLEIDKYE